jgi:hypothetical protein
VLDLAALKSAARAAIVMRLSSGGPWVDPQPPVEGFSERSWLGFGLVKFRMLIGAGLRAATPGHCAA